MALSDSTHTVPYWGLSRFYFFYFAVLGALLPYWSLYLKSIDFDVTAIGWLMAIMTSTRIVAPNLWGWLADRTRQRLPIVRIGAFLGFLFFLGVFFTQDFFWMSLIIFGYSFFWNAVLAQFEVVTLGHLGEQRNTYSHIRLWGSIGFIVAVTGLGLLFDHWPISYLPYFIAALLFLVWASTLTVTERSMSIQHEEAGAGLLDIIRQPAILAFFVVYLLVQVAHGPYYVFFTLYLEELHYNRMLIGQLWALGVVAEVVVFLYMHRIMHRFTLRQIILVSLVLTALRWLMIGYGAEFVGVLLFAQLLHAFSFGTLHAAGIEVVHRYFRGGHEGQGQALYSASSFGAGAAIGFSLSGYLWSGVGPQFTYLLATAVTLVACAVAFIWIRFDSLES